MDGKTVISRIQNPALLADDDVTLWKEVSERFPYFSIGRYLEYINELSHGKDPNIQFVSMYKHNPIVFAQKLRPTENKDISIPFMPEVEEKLAPSAWMAPEPEPVIVPELRVEPETVTVPDIPVWNEPSPTETEERIDFMEHPPKVHVMEDIITSQAEGIADEHAVTVSEENDLAEGEDKSLMVMMSFMDWIEHFHKKNKEEQEEEKEKKALKAAWQKEKLNAIVDEESDEIPESIFRQAMESVSVESDIASEPLAQLLAQQGKTERAIEMYKKLSLRNPEKNAYFADLIRKIHLNNH